MQEVNVNCFILATNWSMPAYFIASVNSWDLLTTALWNRLNWFIFFKLNFYKFFEFFIQHVCSYSPLNSSWTHPTLWPSKKQNQLSTAQISLDVWSFTGAWSPYQGYILKRNCLSLFQQLAVVNYFMTRDRVLCPTLFSCWDLDWFGLAQVLCLLSQLLWVQQPCCVQKALLFL